MKITRESLRGPWRNLPFGIKVLALHMASALLLGPGRMKKLVSSPIAWLWVLQVGWVLFGNGWPRLEYTTNPQENVVASIAVVMLHALPSDRGLRHGIAGLLQGIEPTYVNADALLLFHDLQKQQPAAFQRFL